MYYTQNIRFPDVLKFFSVKFHDDRYKFAKRKSYPLNKYI